MIARACGLLLAFLVSGAVSASQADQLRATGGWIRLLPANLPAGGYLQLQNQSGTPVTLVGVTSSDYAQVMLHQSNGAGGMDRMQPLERLDIPAHARMRLAPGGYHLMLEQPRQPPAVGQQIPLVLHFADGSRLSVPFQVRPANALDESAAAPAAH